MVWRTATGTASGWRGCTGYCGRTWMSGSGGCCWGRRRSGWAVAASRRWPGSDWGVPADGACAGVREAGRQARAAGAGAGRRPQEAGRDRPGAGPGADGAGGAGVAGGSGVAAALDVPVDPEPGGRADRGREPVLGADGGAAAEGARLQPAGSEQVVEGAQHPDRNAQFEHINAKAQDCLERGVPVLSVDTKKKELVGNFKNGGREWQPEGEPDWSMCTTSPTTRSARRSRTASTTWVPMTAS